MASSMDEHLKSKLTEGHFPPRNVEAFNLHRWYLFILSKQFAHLIFCSLRIYPHLQDSGGFFVAVLQKVRKEEP
jgi:multisite-specific tRNA:(cytosine-C5)-methyltransferase